MTYTKEDIQKIFTNILHNSFSFSLSKKVQDYLLEIITKKVENQTIEMNELRDIISTTTIQFFYQTIAKNPHSILFLYLFQPYQIYYYNIMGMLKIDDTQEARNLFLLAVGRILLLYGRSIQFEEELPTTFQQYLRQRNIHHIKEKEESSSFIDTIFIGDKKLRDLILKAFSKREQTLLQRKTVDPEEEDVLKQLQKNIYQMTSVYFLLLFFQTKEEEILNIFRKIKAAGDQTFILKNLQQRLLDTIPVETLLWNRKLRSLNYNQPLRFHVLQIFLGNEPYDNYMPVSSIMENAQIFLNCFQNFSLRSFYSSSHFYYMMRVVDQWKKTQKNYYALIVSYHGVSLDQKATIAKEDFPLYKKMIETLNQEIQDLKQKENNTFQNFQEKQQNFFAFYPQYDPEYLRKLLQLFKRFHLTLYKTLEECHGPSFLECRPIEKKANYRYRSAHQGFRQFIKQYEEEGIYSLEDKVNSTREKVERAMEILRMTDPEYYDIISKKHGSFFDKCNSLNEELMNFYEQAICRLQAIITQNEQVTLFDVLPYTKEDIEEALFLFQKEKISTYRNLTRRFGPSFMEWKYLSKSEKILSFAAYRRFEKYMEEHYTMAPKEKELNLQMKAN